MSDTIMDPNKIRVIAPDGSQKPVDLGAAPNAAVLMQQLPQLRDGKYAMRVRAADGREDVVDYDRLADYTFEEGDTVSFTSRMIGG